MLTLLNAPNHSLHPRCVHKSKKCMPSQVRLEGQSSLMPSTPSFQSLPNLLPFLVRSPLIKRPNSPFTNSIWRRWKRKKTRITRKEMPFEGEKRTSRQKNSLSNSKRGKEPNDYHIKKPHSVAIWNQLCLTGSYLLAVRTKRKAQLMIAPNVPSIPKFARSQIAIKTNVPCIPSLARSYGSKEKDNSDKWETNKIHCRGK